MSALGGGVYLLQGVGGNIGASIGADGSVLVDEVLYAVSAVSGPVAIIGLAYGCVPLLAPLLDILRSPDFAAQVDALGGYDVTDMGRVVWQS